MKNKKTTNKVTQCEDGNPDCFHTTEPVEWEKKLDEELGFFICACREEPCPRSERIKEFIRNLLAQERERQKKRDAAKVWLWHKKHCDCEDKQYPLTPES